MLQETGNSDCKPLPSLVICPPTLTGHWVYEVEKFVSKEYLKPLHYTGPPSERQRLVSGVCFLKYFRTLRRVLYAAPFLSRCYCFSFIILILKNCYLQNISFWKLLQVVQKFPAISKIIFSPKMVSCLSFGVRIILRTCGNTRCRASSTFFYGEGYQTYGYLFIL